MVIGNGLLSKAFESLDSPELVIFASGVSDSTCQDELEYKREFDLLSNTIQSNRNKKIIYFSTCDYYDSSKQTRYIKHKLDIERYIASTSSNWLIFRLPQIIGKGNSKNLIANFVHNILFDIPFSVYTNLDRNLIDISDAKLLVSKYIDSKNEIINIANPLNIKVGKLLEILETLLNKKSKSEKIHDIVNSFIIPLRSDFPIQQFEKDYYYNRIKKFLESQ